MLSQDPAPIDTLVDTVVIQPTHGLGGYQGNLMVVLILAGMLALCVMAGLAVVKWASR